MRRIAPSIWVVCLAALLAACASESPFAPRPSEAYRTDALLAEIDFSAASDWEAYTDPALGVDFRIEDGAYRARIDGRRATHAPNAPYDTGVNAASARAGGFMWALDTGVYADTLIQIDTLPYSTYRDNAYGVMCRASPTNNGDGYYFLISADGQYTIRRGFNREIQALVEWTPSAAIQPDRAPNRIRALCVGNRLALYVNGMFVGEARDALYARGNVGIAAAVPAGGQVDIAFDDLRVWAAAA